MEWAWASAECSSYVDPPAGSGGCMEIPDVMSSGTSSSLYPGRAGARRGAAPGGCSAEPGSTAGATTGGARRATGSWGWYQGAPSQRRHQHFEGGCLGYAGSSMQLWQRMLGSLRLIARCAGDMTLDPVRVGLGSRHDSSAGSLGGRAGAPAPGARWVPLRAGSVLLAVPAAGGGGAVGLLAGGFLG